MKTENIIILLLIVLIIIVGGVVLVMGFGDVSLSHSNIKPTNHTNTSSKNMVLSTI